ncbi:MAG: hypothetical protein L0387_41440 [Acidobacteria bacterium]|nr:hypothetical protein [Acidobacteriota bacterium]MCI0628054.1 hypothetical protein [Acidobacteriota bacterium]
MDVSAIRLSRLPVAVKIALSLSIIMLGIGYLIALLNLYLTYSMTDGERGLTPNDLRRAFYGNRDNTRLAAKIHGGSMEQFLTIPGEKEKVLSWIQDGAEEPKFQAAVKPILDENCIRCHSEAGVASFRPLTSYTEVMTVTEIDRGEPVGLWARVAHTHIQSIGLIFLVLGLAVAFTSISELLKQILVTLPFVALISDFGARALTKYFPSLVYVVMAMGALMGLSFAVMVLLPLYEMWLRKN